LENGGIHEKRELVTEKKKREGGGEKINSKYARQRPHPDVAEGRREKKRNRASKPPRIVLNFGPKKYEMGAWGRGTVGKKRLILGDEPGECFMCWKGDERAGGSYKKRIRQCFLLRRGRAGSSGYLGKKRKKSEKMN